MAPEKAEKPPPPRTLAVAPVNRIVPRPRGTIDLGHLAPHQEAGEAGHLPDLEVDARRGLADREAHVGADVEDRHLDRPDLALDGLDERDHLLFLARVGAEGARLAALALDAGDEGRELVGLAARDAGGEAFAREAPRDGAAGRVARADDKSNLGVRHGGLPHCHPGRSATRGEPGPRATTARAPRRPWVPDIRCREFRNDSVFTAPAWN